MMRTSVILVLIIICSTLVNGDELKVPCHFIFGDTFSDPGNSAELLTLAKANYRPYGIDFPGGIATGRFTNGRNVVDFITQYMGFQNFTTPYTDATDQNILKGVNYAAGIGGILNATGYFAGDRVWMDRQLQYYQGTISKIQSMVQGPVANYLKKCLYTVNLGSEDYVNNYFSPLLFPTKTLYTPEQFASLLVDRYRAQLQVLYDSGARKVVVFGLYRLGCVPAQLKSPTQCNEEFNQAVGLFNTKLVALVDNFNAELPESKFTYINQTSIMDDSNATALQGIIRNASCCKTAVTGLCVPLIPPCANRTQYAFMDGYHSSEVLNEVVAKISFNTKNPMYVHPMNINQVISM